MSQILSFLFCTAVIIGGLYVTGNAVYAATIAHNSAQILLCLFIAAHGLIPAVIAIDSV